MDHKRELSVLIGLFALGVTTPAFAQGGAPPDPAAAPPAAGPPPAAPPGAAPPPAYGPPPGAPPPAGGPPPGPPGAAAERVGARTHDGFYLNLGLNIGYAMVTESFEGTASSFPDRKYSGVSNGFDFLLGGTIAPGFVLGGGIIGVRTGDPKLEQGNTSTNLGGTMLLAGLTGFGQYYFDPHEGLHLQALLGFAVLDYVNEQGNSGGNDPTGFLVGLGVGYDFWVGDEWSIGPIGRVLYASTSTEVGSAKATESYLYPSIGIAFTLH